MCWTSGRWVPLGDELLDAGRPHPDGGELGQHEEGVQQQQNQGDEAVDGDDHGVFLYPIGPEMASVVKLAEAGIKRYSGPHVPQIPAGRLAQIRMTMGDKKANVTELLHAVDEAASLSF